VDPVAASSGALCYQVVVSESCHFLLGSKSRRGFAIVLFLSSGLQNDNGTHTDEKQKALVQLSSVQLWIARY
jgi:hypothetical protein